MSERTDDLTREVDDGDALDDATDFGVGESTGFGVDDGLANDFGGSESSEFGTEESVVSGSDQSATSGTGGGLRNRVPDSVERVFSVSSFLFNLVAALVGTFVVGGAVPLGQLSGFFGVFVAILGLGLFSSEPRYVEAGLAGGISGVVTTVLSTLTLSVISGGMLPVAGGVVGAIVALLGHYAGRDLRDGLTKDL